MDDQYSTGYLQVFAYRSPAPDPHLLSLATHARSGNLIALDQYISVNSRAGATDDSETPAGRAPAPRPRSAGPATRA